jgi:hypothetical protein
MSRPKPEFDEVRKVLAFDEAVAQLQAAGIAESFIAAIEKDPNLKKAIEKMAPKLSAAASPGWSCCITVKNPQVVGDERSNPAR